MRPFQGPPSEGFPDGFSDCQTSVHPGRHTQWPHLSPQRLGRTSGRRDEPVPPRRRRGPAGQPHRVFTLVRAHGHERRQGRHRAHRSARSRTHGLGLRHALCARQRPAGGRRLRAAGAGRKTLNHLAHVTRTVDRQQKTARRRFFAFLCWQRTRFKRQTPRGPGWWPDGSGRWGGQAVASASALTLADRRLLSRAALFLWKMPLSAMMSTTPCILEKSSVALVLSPARTAFSTFLTAVRYLERSEVLAAFSLTSWRARLRPDARLGFFFFGLVAMVNFLQMFGDDASKACNFSMVPPCLGRVTARPRGRVVTLAPVSLFKSASLVSLLTLASRITG